MSESAVPTPSEGSEGGRRRNADPVERFQSAYEEALAAAKVSAELTTTTGWLALYEPERRVETEQRRKLAERLKSVAAALRDHGSSEDLEKSLGEIKKSAAEIRERRQHFDVTTVEPVRKTVADCEKVLDESKREARRLEADQPLIHRDLVKRMDRAVAAVQRPTWDEEKGTVSIQRPGKSSLN